MSDSFPCFRKRAILFLVFRKRAILFLVSESKWFFVLFQKASNFLFLKRSDSFSLFRNSLKNRSLWTVLWNIPASIEARRKSLISRLKKLPIWKNHWAWKIRINSHRRFFWSEWFLWVGSNISWQLIFFTLGFFTLARSERFSSHYDWYWYFLLFRLAIFQRFSQARTKITHKQMGAVPIQASDFCKQISKK